MRKSMFRKGGSSIRQVLEGPGTIKFRGVFREGSKVRRWEALLQIFVICGALSKIGFLPGSWVLA